MANLKYPAKYLVFWPGQEVKACEPHLGQLQTLNSFMGGTKLSYRVLLADIGEAGECSNCVNEKEQT